MSLNPFAPLYLGSSRCARPLPSRRYRPCRSSHSLHCISAAPAALDRYPRGVTGHVAHPIRSIQRFLLSNFYFLLLFSVLLIANLLHPLNDFSVQSLLNGDMRHRRSWTCPMPVLFVRRKPNHIAWPNLFDRSTFALRPTKPGRDDQRLTEWMRMPGGAGTRFERDACATNTCRFGRLKQRIDSDIPSEPFRGSLARRTRINSLDFHQLFSFSAFQSSAVIRFV